MAAKKPATPKKPFTVTSNDVLLMDADVLCYGAATNAEQEIRWDEDTFSIYSELPRAQAAFKRRVEKWQEFAGFTDPTTCQFELAWTDGVNFRKGLNEEYKTGRPRKPVGYGALKEWAIETYPSFVRPGLEADDCMGILATRFPGKYVIQTIDKDLLTIPGRMIRISADGRSCEYHLTDADLAHFRFLSQALAGDKTDGYDGIHGMGKTKADALLKKHGVVWETVLNAYLAADMTAEDALLNARMARILHDTDWDFANREVKLWTP